jgi:hypothetical protein
VTAIAAATGDVSPGLIGFLVVAFLGASLYFLIKSMNRQISKIEVPHEADLAKERAGRGTKESSPKPDDASGPDSAS